MKQLNRTKLWFSVALKELSQEKPLKKITVTDLVTHCGVNRGTFYYHFKDIQDLINWTYHVDVTLPTRARLKEFSMEDVIAYRGSGTLVSMTNVYAAKEFYRQAIQIQGQNDLQDFMLNENTENWAYLWNTITQQEAAISLNKSEVAYVLEYFGHAHHYALLHWIKSGMEEPPEKIAKIIDIASLRGLTGLLKNP